MIKHSSNKRPESAIFSCEMRKMIDRFRGELPLEETLSQLLGYVSSYLFLRWVELEDRKQQAIAKSDGSVYKPLFSDSVSPRRWFESDSNLLGERQSKTILSLQSSSNPLARWAREVVDEGALNFIGQREPQAQRELCLHLERALGHVDVSTPEGRGSARLMLDSLIEFSVSGHRTFMMEAYTPQPVVDLMVELADPVPGERIYDPCFGMGGILASVAQRIMKAGKTYTESEWQRLQSQTIFGGERVGFGYGIATTRIVLSGINRPSLQISDSLTRSPFTEKERFDVVLACPPWGYKNFEEKRNQNFRVPSRDITNLFLQHTMQSLRPGGRAIIAIPEKTLFSSGDDKQLRQILLEEFEVEGVISLPEGAFAPVTGVKSNLLLFRKNEPKSNVRFSVVSQLTTSTRQRSMKLSKPPHVIARDFRSSKNDKAHWSVPISKLAKRDWELIAKRTGADALQKQIDALKNADNSIEECPLDKVAELFTGVSYGKKHTTQDGHSDSFGVVRSSDIKDGRVNEPEIFLTKEIEESVTDLQVLQENDILLTRSGRIGNVSIVSRGTDGRIFKGRRCVAARNIIVIRPGKMVLPAYLAAILNSEVYQNWMHGHARGSAVQHLSLKTLQDLTIPVADLQLQKMSVHDFPQQLLFGKFDGIESMLKIVCRNSRRTQLQIAVNEKLRVTKRVANWKKNSFLMTIEKFASNFPSTYVNDNGLPEWWGEWEGGMETALENVGDITEMMAGSAQYAVLNQALGAIHILSHELEDLEDHYSIDTADEEIIETMQTITKWIEGIINQARYTLLESVDLKATLQESTISTGKEIDLLVSITNLSVLPLMGMVFSTNPDFGKSTTPYLAESATHMHSLTIPAQVQEGKLPLRINWSCRSLSGDDIEGVINLAIDVQSTKEAGQIKDFGASPYIAGPPIDQAEMFFGREDVISQVERQLSTTNRANVLLLEGNRRTGKTSILKQLGAGKILKGWIPVYCSFQGGTGDKKRPGLPTAQVFKTMAVEIFKAVADTGVRVWFPGEEMPATTGLKFQAAFIKSANQRFTVNDPFDEFKLFLEAVLQEIAPHRLLLMLDEFDKLQEGIESGVTSPEIPGNIRYLLHEYPNISAILSYPRLRELRRHEYWSVLFGLGHTIQIRALDDADALQLVTKPAVGKLVYTEQAANRIVQDCAGQPFLIQKLCNHVFDLAANAQDQLVTEGLVSKAAGVMAKDDEHFATLWQNHIRTECQRHILVLAVQHEGTSDRLNIKLLEIKLEEAGLQIRGNQQIGDDLEFLCELELLSMDNEGAAYHLAIPLMSEWIRHNVDFENQKRKSLEENEKEAE